MVELKDAIRQHIEKTAPAGSLPANFETHTPLQSSGLLDSLAVLGLISFVEKEFKVEFSAVELTVDNFDTIDQIANLVTRKQK